MVHPVHQQTGANSASTHKQTSWPRLPTWGLHIELRHEFPRGKQENPESRFSLENLIHTISTGHFGVASRKAWPYRFVRTRLSRITTIPWSVFVRINRPTPWRNFRM